MRTGGQVCGKLLAIYRVPLDITRRGKTQSKLGIGIMNSGFAKGRWRVDGGRGRKEERIYERRV